jgi:hypothetical protein
MAGNMEVARRLGELLMSRPQVRERARRAGKGGIGLSARPNAPKLVTIFVAVALTVVGLAVTRTVEIKPVLDLLESADLSLSKEQGWLALLASPVLLVVGSFFRGI